MQRTIPVFLAAWAMGCAAAPATEGARLMRQDEKDTARLTAIGGLSATSLYFTFVTVGIASDAFEHSVYDADKTRTIVQEVKNVLQVNADQLKAVVNAGLDAEDKAALDEAMAIGAMIQEYAGHLAEYSKGREKKHADAFQAARTKTWERIKKFLGIE